MGCDASVHSYTFPSDAIAYPGDVWRAVDDRADVLARERYVWFDSCDTPNEGGWIALCAGPCDLSSCTNFLDYAEKTGSSSPPSPPACASFAGGPINVGSATATDSLSRTSYAGSGAAGVASDWTVAPATRD